MARRLSVTALVALAFAGARPAAGDVLPRGYQPVHVRVRMDWGSLSGRLSRPVVPRDDDTWESLAAREAGDLRWAPTIRAMTGRDTAPAGPTLPAWLPPRGLPFGPQAAWWSAYVDSSKFGRDSDVSRTGFDRVDPGPGEIPVFSTVTFCVRRHVGSVSPESEAAWKRVSAKDVIANPKAAGVAIAPSFEVPTQTEERSRLRRVVQSRRVESVNETELRLRLLEEKRFDAEGAPLSAGGMSSSAWIPAFLGAGLLVLVAALRRRRAPAAA
jgi:hypothetical protein